MSNIDHRSTDGPVVPRPRGAVGSAPARTAAAAEAPASKVVTLDPVTADTVDSTVDRDEKNSQSKAETGNGRHSFKESTGPVSESVQSGTPVATIASAAQAFGQEQSTKINQSAFSRV